MSTMIERVALAIDMHMREQRWSAEGVARAAIEAMRDPTPQMLRAAGAAMSPGKRPTDKRVSERAKHGIRYRAMIDAALQEAT